MSQTTPQFGDLNAWTPADLLDRFGPIPLYRIRTRPAPGTASEQDVVDLELHDDRLCELVDGVLVEKDMGTYEAYLAGLLVQFIGAFVRDHDLGFVLPPDGMLRLAPGLVRLPDVSFISWQRAGGREIPKGPVSAIAPDLAIEVISQGNTPQEMSRKLNEYFAAGVRQVWYVYPVKREVYVYTSTEQPMIIAADDCVDGGDVLPGFSLSLAELFKV